MLPRALKNIQQQFGLSFYVLKLEGLVRESVITSSGSSNPGMVIATGMYPRLAVAGIMHLNCGRLILIICSDVVIPKSHKLLS